MRRRTMKRDRRRGGSRKRRSRPTPKWLLSAADLDQVAKERCLMVLAVLSGEKPVTDAIQEAGISRGTYYKLETQALSAMLRALGPLATAEGTEASPVRRIAFLEGKVKELERAHRRSQRLLLMTRRVMKTGSIRSGRNRLPISAAKSPKVRKPPSTPLPTGVAGP
jgi:hypothetical protein